MELRGRVARVEFARLAGKRPRIAGSNARLGVHGGTVSPPILRITLDSGACGFGWARVEPEDARRLLGVEVGTLFSTDPEAPFMPTGVRPEWRMFDFPLWDLAGQLAGRPVYELVSRSPGIDDSNERPFAVPCYDTSLYMDDLELTSDADAVDLLVSEALAGAQAGHTGFKVKIGRGGMHMDLERGMIRDAKIVLAIRAAIGSGGTLMVDANNGFNYNLSCRFLEDTASADLYWIEEMFHEDPIVYRRLKEWMQSRGLVSLIADGEGDAASHIEEWASDGLIDVIQYDLRARGFSGWLELGPRFDAAGIRSAPHNYGEPTTNYYACHLSSAIQKFERVEWDQATVEGLTAPGYLISEGEAQVPRAPGFGLELDEKHYARVVAESGFRLNR